MQKILFLYAILIINLSFTTGVNATPNDKKIILSFTPDGWPPYLIKKTDGTSIGIMVDVLKSIASTHGYKVIIEQYPEKRGLFNVEVGLVDAYPKAKEWVPDPERYIWTDPVVESVDVLVFLKQHPLVFRSPEDLFGKKIGTGLGYGYPLLEPYFKDQRIYRDDSTSEWAMLMKVLFRRTDAAIMNQLVALWIIRQNLQFQGKFDFSEGHVGEAGYRFMFTRKYDWQPYVRDFNKELTQMKQDGRLEKILAQYQ